MILSSNVVWRRKPTLVDRICNTSDDGNPHGVLVCIRRRKPTHDDCSLAYLYGLALDVGSPHTMIVTLTYILTDVKRKLFLWLSPDMTDNTNSAIFEAISWKEQVNFQWDDDEVHFVLDQHA